ncbi:monovalent cation/H+ antiporter complex subunit F [Myxococcota bacterium]|nr:monovalent cation/H+ antiporter complex subunit F [Myxococcota bacterium]
MTTLELVLSCAQGALVFAFAAALFRVVRGPTLADRVLALDFVSYVAIALVALRAISLGAFELVDVTLGIALVSFVATITAARFLRVRAAGGGVS